MAEDLKEGTRVRIVLEGTTEDEWVVMGDRYEYGAVLFDDGSRALYFENLPCAAVEVVPKPLKSGLYYQNYDGLPQMTCVYKLDTDGTWYDNRLDVIQMTDELLAELVPLVKGER